MSMSLVPLGLGLTSSLVGAPSGDPALINFKAAQFTAWKAGVGRVQSSLSRAAILWIGDSTTRGVGSGDVTTYVNAKLYGFVTKAAQQLAALGIPSNTQDFLGSGAVAIANINTYYPGLSVGAGWVVSSAQTMAGFCLANNVDATTFTFAPTVNINNFQVYYPLAPTAGVLQYSLNGGAAVQISETAANGFASTIIPVARSATNSIAFSRFSGNAYIAGIRAYDNTITAVDFLNLGASGWKAADWATATVEYNALPALKYLAGAADLAIIDLTINDSVTPTVTATFKTQIQAIIDGLKAAKPGISILLLTGNPADSTFASLANQAAILQAYIDLATTNDLPLINQFIRDVDYLTMNAKGWMFDTAHPNKLGHADLGTYLGNVLNTWAA